MLRSGLVLFGSLAVFEPARAQTTSLPEGVTINAQVFEPAFTGDFLWTETARPSPEFLGGRLVLHWDRQLLRVEGDDGEPIDVVGDLFGLDVLGSISKGPLRIGAGIPVVAAALGDTHDPRSGLGDLRFDGRVTLLGRATSPAGLALRAAVILPTSTLEPDLANAGVVGDVSVIGDGTIGPVLLAGSFGARFTEHVEIGDVDVGGSIYARLGVGVRPGPRDGITGELIVRSAYANVDTWRDVPAEGMLGYWHGLGRGWIVRAGLSAGLTPAPGSPQMRLVVAIEKAPHAPPDPDHDGLGLADDRCPREAETVNDVRDADGCPEDDRVLALAPVTVLPFALDVATIEGAVPVEGAPTDPAHPVPKRSPLGDPDGDGISDQVDFCPDEAEDFDGFEDGDGCPEGDNDGDRLRDADDACPVEAETRNGFEDRDGCPDVSPLADTIASVGFEPSSSDLSSAARALLKRVLAPLKADPTLRLSIDGHSDVVGTSDVNQDLSLRRATVVQAWLVAHGIDASRLTTAGHGSLEPAASNDTPEGRAQNRRVDLSISVETSP